MENAKGHQHIDEEIKEAFQNNSKMVAEKVQKYLEKENNIPLNIAVTGETGAGKSTFINAIRGIRNNEEGAAPVGVTETTTEVAEYHHPNFLNVKLYDLPGVGSTNFPVAEYLKLVEFEKYDFFIIASQSRFSENDVNLAKEIQKMEKKFYFVRSKIDIDIRNAEEDQMDFNAEETLTTIRDDCIKGLQRAGFESPQVFLVSSKKLHLYEFPLLQETLERELPDHKKDVFLLAMPNTSLEMINKKKKAFQNNIKYVATLSALGAAVPIPGLSVAVDLPLLASVITKYVFGFGLDIKSLKKMAEYLRVPYEELRSIITTPLAEVIGAADLLLKVLSQLGIAVTALAAEEGARFIPVLGIPIAMGLSFCFTCNSLNMILDLLAEDAKRVFQKVIEIIGS